MRTRHTALRHPVQGPGIRIHEQAMRILAVGVVASVMPAMADAQVFSGTVSDLTGVTSTNSFSVRTVELVVDRFSEAQLQSVLPGYAPTDAIVGSVDFRGIPMAVAYALGSNTLEFAVPEIGFRRSFVGVDRPDANRQLLDFLRSDRDFLGRLGKALAAHSPADPIAGNPNSLQSTMIAGDFAQAIAAAAPFLDDEASRTSLAPPLMVAQAGGALPPLRTGAVGNMAGAGVSGASLSTGGVRSNLVSVPLQYNSRSDIDPRQGFSIRFPISYATWEGSQAAAANLGFAYRYALSNRWILTPSIGYGVTGSADLGSVGHMLSGSLTSTLGVRFASFDLVVANMIGHYRTVSAGGGQYSYNPEIANTAFRNGLVLSKPVAIAGAQRSVQGYVVDTRTTGAELFVDNWQEIGITVGSRPRVNLARDYGSFSLGYLRSSSYRGLTFQASYLF